MKSKLQIGTILTVFKKTLSWIITIFLIALTCLILLLQTPFFQNLITQKALLILNDNCEEEIKISKIKINWLDLIELHQLQVNDYQGNVLLNVDKIEIDYALFRLITKNQINIDKLTVENGTLNLAKYDDERPINLVSFIASIKKLTPEKKNKKEVKASGKVNIDKVYSEGFLFSYNNYQVDSLNTDMIDLAHLALDISKLDIADFELFSDTIICTINAFSANEINSGFTINSLSSGLELSNSRIVLGDLNLKLSQSQIEDSGIIMNYTGLSDLGYFTDSVAFDFQIKKSAIYPDDIAYFAQLPKEAIPITFSGNIKGKVSNLSVNRMNLGVLKNSFLIGSIDLIGLPAIGETFIILDIDQGQIHPKDFGELITKLPEEFQSIGDMKLSGQFSGFIKDFVAKVKISTNKGQLVSDLNLKVPSGWENAKYSGGLKLTNFNAGAFLNKRDLIQKINFEGIVKGQGLTLQNANFFTRATLTNSSILGYKYQSIKATGKFASEFFEGDLVVNDPNLKFSSHGYIDLNTIPEKINVQADINFMDFRALGLVQDSLTLVSKIDFDLLGLNIDSLNSQADIKDLSVNYKGRRLDIDSIYFLTNNKGSRRNIDFRLPEIEGEVKGDFLYTQLLEDANYLFREVSKYFNLSNEDSEAINEKIFQEYQLDFSIKYGDLSKYFEFLSKEIYLSSNGSVEGSYQQRKNAMLNIYASVDSLNYNGLGFKNNSFDINFIKQLDSAGIMAIANLISQTQYWKGIPSTSNLQIEALWEDNSLDIYSNIDQKGTNSQASINAKINFFEDKLIFKFLPSNVRFLDKRWLFDPDNLIEYDGDIVKLSQLNLNQLDQRIELAGQYSDTLDTRLKVKFDNFDLHIVSNFVPVQLGGALNGFVEATRSTDEDFYHVASDISVIELMVDDYFVGDMKGGTSWEPVDARLKIDMSILRESINTIDLFGYYYPQKSSDQMDLKLAFDKANLKLLASLVEGSISKLEGEASGNIFIKGTTNKPELDGYARLNSGKLTYDYLGVTYLFDGDISFNNKSIGITELLLKDRDGNKANLSGNIYHNAFKQIRPDISIKTDKFLFLNTTSTSNELYYGTAYASGLVNILGFSNDLLIQAKIKSEKGTKLYFPLEEDAIVEQKDYISFVDFSDTTKAINVEEKIQNISSKVRLDFDLEVTPDAYVELIFNMRTGDIIKGSAKGNLKLVLDTDGEFDLFGEVGIVEGAYNFTSSIAGATLLSKEFKIESGGRITWYGDPTKGILDLNAIYRQFASLSDFRATAGTTEQTVSSKIPVLVVLSLKGEMLSPDIGFQIKIDDTQSSASVDDQADIQRINDNEQELKRQVFSLLILRRFSPRDEISVQSSGRLTSISEFLTNQLSYYASQFNENLEIDLDLASMDPNAFRTLQLRLSYTFLDGRLRVSGGGGFNQNGADVNTTQQDAGNTFVGDWSVQYLLTNDGRLRVKAFRQADQVSTNGQQSETGVSIQLIKSFDDFKEFVPKERERALKRKDDQVEKSNF